MAFPFLQVAQFALQAGGSFLQQQGQANAARAEARQRNRSLLSNYNYDLQKYNFDVQQQKRIYAEQVRQYEQQVKFNNRALQDAYDGEQRKLSDFYDQLTVKQNQEQINLAKNQGKFQASGQTGGSIRRLENLQTAALGRLTALQGASYESAEGQARFNMKRFQLQNEAANARAYADVAIAPMFAPPPQRPTLNRVPPNRAGLSIATSLLGNAGSLASALPDSLFGLGGSGGGGNSLLDNIINEPYNPFAGSAY